MKRKLFVCALAAVALLSGCGTLRESPEEQARVAAQVERRLDARSFRVDIESMQPLRGPRQILSTPYAIIIHDDRINSHLPYRGVAYEVPYGGGKVLTFEDDIQTYRDYPQGDRRVVPGAKHEIYRSQDEILFPWWHEVIGFLKGTED